jgi:steroid delta-isomerase-like uncharacterized protein
VTTLPSKQLIARRDEIVRAHMDAESRGDWLGALETFHEARYEVMCTREVHDGAVAVQAFYDESATAFPDLTLELEELHHTDGGVFVEVDLVATHLGAWRGLPPTGRAVRYRMCNLFVFDEDRLVCERMYFDLLTVLQQIGIARDPASLAGRLATAVNHPVTVARALIRGAAKKP